MNKSGWAHRGCGEEAVDGGKNSRPRSLGHSTVVSQEIEELAKKARRGVTCEVVGALGECK